MSNYDTTQFEKDLHSLSVTLTAEQIAQFLTYYELLAEWNEKMNLTAITAYEDVMKKHFIDSISLVKAYDVTKSATVIDVGTGAGFPGLALKIAFPNLQVTLLDSLNKRVHFLNAVIDKLELTGVRAIHGRAEDYAKFDLSKSKRSLNFGSGSKEKKKSEKPDSEQMEHSACFRERYDLCVSRAVANLSTLSEYCLPFVKVGGQFISYKSEKISQEITDAEKAIQILGGKLTEQVDFYLPDSDIYRNLVVIEKLKRTPDKYPRKAGLPAKEPLVI